MGTQASLPVIFLVGPTASGKTAVSLAVCRRYRAAVISCDSMQIYAGMEILTQAPSALDRRRIPHYLVAERRPSSEFDVSTFVSLAQKRIRACFRGGYIPLVVGGSGLYVRGLTQGIFAFSKKDHAYRRTLQREAAERGVAALHERLGQIDPPAAAKINPNDLRRIVRALEVYHLSGVPISTHQRQTISPLCGCRVVLFGLGVPRDRLYARIDERVDRMLADGVVDEVRALKKKSVSLTASQALGYTLIGDYLEGTRSYENMRDELKKQTRQYAKSQLTWFRANKDIVWLAGDREPERIADDLVNAVEERGFCGTGMCRRR